MRDAKQAALTGAAIVAGAFGITAAIMQVRGHWQRSPIETIQITGTVLTQNRQPDQQSPIANATIVATGGFFEQEGKSDAAGLFQLKLHMGFGRRNPIHLKFEHPGYKPTEIDAVSDNRIYVVRMEPLISEPEIAGQEGDLPIKDVRVRYTLRSETTTNIGSVAKRFEVVNKGGAPCAKSPTCSPDKKWKANIGALSMDAGGGNEFQNIRVTCIAGPCPFTAIAPVDPPHPSRLIKVSATDWSDTAVFLVEAELTRNVVSNSTRRLYPTIIGRTMTFALPAGADGLAIEANLNGEEIVYPIGPKTLLSWATCGVTTGKEQNRTYRCEVKSGYTFPQ